MGPEHSSQSPGGDRPAPPAVPPSLDEAIEAIVYEEHPALAAGPARPFGRPRKPPDDYPYQPRPRLRLPPPNSDSDQLTQLLDSIGRGLKNFAESVSREPDYVVPKRFGMSAILGIMTALALVFGILRFVSAEPYYYAFFAIESITICLAQMLYGKAPRLASIVAGAVILPVFTIVAAQFSANLHGGQAVCMSLGFIPFGALLGYITGTCAAGVFLVMDQAESYWKGEHHAGAIQPSRPAA